MRVFVWAMERGLDSIQNTFFGMLDQMIKIHFCVAPNKVEGEYKVYLGYKVCNELIEPWK